MKYTCEVLINLPRKEVVEKLDNPDNMKFWQKGLVRFQHLNGEPGKPGAESKLIYLMGKRRVEMIETITFTNLPEEIHLNYFTKGVVNIQKNYFDEEGDKTRWVSECIFKFSGFMKFMSFFMGSGAFKKQSQLYLDDFKAFAEGNPKYGT